MANGTLTALSSEPLTSRLPFFDGQQLLTNDVCSLSFFTRTPTTVSHAITVLSAEAENSRLGCKQVSSTRARKEIT